MSILEAYDESEEILKAVEMTKGEKRLPEIAIVTFKRQLIDTVADELGYEEYSGISAGDWIKIYKGSHAGKDIIVYRTLIGGASTAGMMEELIARGVKKFIFFGSCGTLDKNIEPGAFILPTEAYRDEGLSYHYLPVSDFVDVDTAERLAEIFAKNKIKYIHTKTWTTDALYKETVNKVKDRKEKGCLVVEMECASIMAVAKARGVEAYQFLYSADTLDNEEWDVRTLRDDKEFILDKCFEIALKVVEEI